MNNLQATTVTNVMLSYIQLSNTQSQCYQWRRWVSGSGGIIVKGVARPEGLKWRWGSWEWGSQLPPHQLWDLGSAVSSPSGVEGSLA